MAKTPFTWTNDDITFGQAVQLRRQVDFLAQWSIQGTFFIIPKFGDNTIDEDPELLKAIEYARGKGHEFHQHGYIHSAYESGVPDLGMLAFSDEVSSQFDDQRFEIEQSHMIEAMVQMLERGRKIWRRAFGEDSLGYRPGWGAYCGNLFRALELLGYEWVSWRVPCITSWQWSFGRWDAPLKFRDAMPVKPLRRGKLYDYLLGGDYAFHVPNDLAKIDAMINLALKEFDIYHQNGWPMPICSHWHGLEFEGGSGYAIHEKLLDRLLESGNAEPISMTELHKRTQSSQLEDSRSTPVGQGNI